MAKISTAGSCAKLRRHPPFIPADGLPIKPVMALLQKLRQLFFRPSRPTLDECARRFERGSACLCFSLDDIQGLKDRRVIERLLHVVAERVRADVRGSDQLDRVQGDEFVLILDSLSNIKDARTVARRVISLIAAINRVGEHPVRLSVCVGIALVPPGTHPAPHVLPQAIRAAHTALSSARQKGQGHCCEAPFNPDKPAAA